MRIIDLRSDTVTQPTPAMRDANIGATRAAFATFSVWATQWMQPQAMARTEPCLNPA